MPLLLYQTPSVAPFLSEILRPVVEKHFRFKLKDSFLVLTPDWETRQDIERSFLLEPGAGEVLIGNSIQTLSSFWQWLLLYHPNAKPQAPEVLKRKVLEPVLGKFRPDLKLDVRGKNRCLWELARLGQLQRLRPDFLENAPFLKIQREFEQTLERQYQLWTAEKSVVEAMNTLAKCRIPIENVEEVFLLGFTSLEADLLSLIGLLLQSRPNLQIHCFLPSMEKLMDKQSWLERAVEILCRWSKDSTFTLNPAPPLLRQLSYATPVHESRTVFGELQRREGTARILSPASGSTLKLLVDLFSGQAKNGSTVVYNTLDKLESDPENPLLNFPDFLTRWSQLLREECLALAARRDGNSLRELESTFTRLQEWSQAEAWDPRFQPLKSWVGELRGEFLQAAPHGARIPTNAPLRFIDHAGLQRSPYLYIVGLNEGLYPPPSRPFLLAEGLEDGLSGHQKLSALEQSYFLAEKEAVLSFSEMSLSGRFQNPAPMITELERRLLTDPIQDFPLEVGAKHPYFAENVGREKRRSLAGELNLDAGNFSSLGLEELILEDVCSHPLSASYLDAFVKCPWMFFAKRHLRLEDRRAEDLVIEPTRRGRLQHSLLENVFRELEATFFKLGRIPSPSDLESGLEGHFKKVSEMLPALEEFQDFPPVVLQDQLERMKRQVQGVLAAELGDWMEAEEKLFPRYFEWSFGKKGEPEVHYAFKDGMRIPLSGVIDRIDVSPAGQYLVLDYKASGSENLARNLRQLKSFQLFIYLHAVRQTLMKDKSALGALYWDLKKQKKNQGMVVKENYQGFTSANCNGHSFVEAENFAAWQEALDQALKAVLERILAGDYSLNPLDCLGDRCEFFEICRYEHKPK